jgi:hypothetical protein
MWEGEFALEVCHEDTVPYLRGDLHDRGSSLGQRADDRSFCSSSFCSSANGVDLSIPTDWPDYWP